MPAVEKHVVATELLERAIELYLRGDSYYAAVHLAGAAEEVLCVYAREPSAPDSTPLVPAFDHMKDAFLKVSAPSTPQEHKELEKWIHNRLSDAKNSVKHKRGAKDNSVEFDAKEEAYEVIDRAISTHFQLFSVLNLRPLRSIEEFDARHRQEPNE